MGVNRGMEVALCARWVRWPPVAPRAWSGLETPMMVALTAAAGSCVVPGTIAGATMVGCSAIVAVSAAAAASASVPAVISTAAWVGAAIGPSPGGLDGGIICWGPGAWGGADGVVSAPTPL